MKLTTVLLPLLGPLIAADQTPLTNSEDVTRIDHMPAIGFGTWELKVSPSNTTASVSAALQAGYRHIDGAKAYGNQEAVGKGIKEGLKKSGVKREDIWVTSKLYNDAHSNVEGALNQTLNELGLDYLDLYLMHWPVGQYGKEGPWVWDYVETWKAMEKLLALGTVRYIGICNFAPRELFQLLRAAKVRPYNHQFEIHPYLQQRWWVEYHKDNGIAVTGYSPLANTNPVYKGRSVDAASDIDNELDAYLEEEQELSATEQGLEMTKEGVQKTSGRPNTYPPPPPLLKNPVVKSIGERHNATAAQVALAWGIKRGYAVIPKSSHVSLIEEDWESIGVVEKLDFADLKKLEWVGRKWLHRFNNPGKGWDKHLFAGLDGHELSSSMKDVKGELR